MAYAGGHKKPSVVNGCEVECPPMKNDQLSRRNFLQIAALSLGALGNGSAFALDTGGAGISLILDPADPVASTAPVSWAMQELNAAISATGIGVRRFPTIERAPHSD